MAQNNRLKYYISFEADTKKAKSQIDDMMRSLERLNSPQKLKNDLPLNKELLEAHNNVAKLKGLLNDAVNVDTNRIDLSKLNKSLQQSGISLGTFRRSFNELGNEGVVAFTKIVEAVQKGEVPLKRQNALFDRMAETMRNTVRWQISATALNAFTTAINNAYRYAEDLNRSLNDIRIVTGQSVEQMDAFANKANAAARELRTTTKAYTDAALIFYQQGLEDDEVLERTNAVMKMANVTGENATQVSSYMTAIWNNFEDGSKTLEYYGDVITKLGAATAASSEEIAGGIEKFAAIADTVGLSYEYATAALATVVDQTRQSEDVVGTAFRTIFARLSSLSLGETLEDGVTLTKYSKALEKVGVDILNQHDQLKEMDVILDELGTKWETLDSSQKTALATTVAGVRQYSQLIALMDNYDLFKANVDLAFDSEGTLTEQAKIFEESWLGAQRRVTAALEGIYNQLLEDDIFIFFTNGLASILEAIDWVIERAGGLPAVLSLAAIIVQRVFGKTIADLFRDIQSQIDIFTGKTKKESVALLKDISSQLAKMNGEAAGRQLEYNNALIKTSEIYGEILLKAENLTEEQKAMVKEQMTLIQNIAKTTMVTNQELDSRLAEKGTVHKTAVTKGYGKVLKNLTPINSYEQIVGENGLFKTEGKFKEFLGQKKNRSLIIDLGIDLETNLTKTEDKKHFIDSIKKNLGDPNLQRLLAKKQQNFAGDPKIIADYLKADAAVFEAQQKVEYAEDAVNLAANEADRLINWGQLDKNKEELKNAKDERKEISIEYANSVKNNFIEATEQAFTGTFQLISGLSALSSAFKTLGDDSLSVSQKVGNFLTSFTLGAPQFIMGAKNLVSAGKEIKAIFADPILMKGLTEAFPKSLGKIAGGATTLKAAFATWSPYILMVVAGITSLIAVANAFHKSSLAGRLEKTKEVSQQAAKAAQEAAKEYSKLKQTIEGFNDSYNAIADMTVGTEEWLNATTELNNEIQSIIDKYSALAVMEGITNTHFLENGQLVLTKEFEDFVLAQAKKQSAISNLTSAGLSDDAKDIEADIAIKNAKKEAAEIIEGPLGAIFGSNKIETLINEFAEGKLPITLETLKDKLKELNIVLEDDKLKDLFSVIIEASGKAASANSGMGAAIAPYAKQYLANNGINIDSNIEDEYYNVLGERLDSEIDAETQKLLNIRQNAPSAEYLTWTQEEVAELFDKEIKKNWLGQYYYTNAEGEHVLTDEQIARQKATANRYNNLENNIISSYSDDLEDAKNLKRNKIYTIDELVEKDWSDEMSKTARDKASSELEDKEVDIYKEHLEDFTKLTDKTSQFGEETAKAEQMLERIAVANMRFNKGLEDIIDNWDEYFTTITEVNKGTDEYAQMMDQLKGSASELLDIEKSAISDDFILENMILFKEAAHGSIEAIEQLRENAALAELEALDSSIKTTEGFEQLKNWITNFNENYPDLQVGASLDTTDFDNALISLLEASGMTAEEMERALNSIGFEPVIEYVPIDYKSAKNFGGAVYREVDGKKELVSEWDETMEDSGQFFIPTINAKQTTYRGSPKATISATNRSKGASNASSRRKDMKKADDEIERYHLIKETIEDLNRELDRLGKEKDRAWGNAHLQYIDREIAKTEEAIDAQKEYLRQIEENYGKDRGALAAYGGQFDENGRLTNYEELMREQIAKYNAAVRSGSEAQQEAAEEQYNNFKKALEQYEETADLFESEYEQLLDLQNQYYDKLLERIQYKVEVDVQISEEADKYYDYILDMLEDKAYSAAEAIAYLGKKTDESLKQIASYQEALNSMFEMHGFGDDAYERFANGELSIEELATAGFTSQEIDMLIEYRGALMEENKQLMEMRDQVMSSLTDTFDEYMDTLDKMIDKFDHLNAVTSAYKNIVDIVGKKALGISNDMLRAMDEATVATAENTVKASKDRLDAAEAAMADMEKLEADYQEAMANANKATSEDERLYWLGEAQGISDAMEHIEEESRAAKEAFLGSWEEALITAREVFENNVQLAMEEFEDAVSGIYGSLDAMKEAYDQNKVLREQYLEEYERIYELNKLNRDITNSMDDVDSIAAKQTLRDLQEEINELQRSGAQISKYDLDMLRMRYELRLAEIALEDAQNAKSQVRMSRDNDGNWSYVYTADEATVADAAQTYEDKMFQMQQTSNDYLDQISEQWIATTIEMEQAYQKIYEDRTLSDEERMAAIDRLTEYYDSRFLYFNDQITNALGNNQILYEEDWAAWANKNNIQIESNDSFLTNFGDTVLGLTTGFETIDGLHQQLITAVGSPDGGGYLGELDKSYTDWQEDVDRIMEAAGTSVENFGEDFAKVAEDTVQESENIADEVDDMAGQMEDAFSDVVDAVQDWRDEYSNAIADNIDANSRMIQSLGELLVRINEAIDAQIELNRLTGEGATSRSGGSDNGGNKTGNPKKTSDPLNGKTKWVIIKTATGEQVATFPFSTVEERAKQGLEAEKVWMSEYLGHAGSYHIAELMTGGYTGSWGSEGRAAILHEKELVLNKDDTANFLSAISIVRDIVKVVDMNAAISGMGIGALAAGGIAGAGSTIEQSVTIYADFPNATDHSEIELALANLMNSASQYANRKG